MVTTHKLFVQPDSSQEVQNEVENIYQILDKQIVFSITCHIYQLLIKEENIFIILISSSYHLYHIWLEGYLIWPFIISNLKLNC